MADDLRGIPQADVSNARSTLEIDGKTYRIDRMRQGAVSKTIQWMRDQRMQSIINATRFIESVSPDTRGVALAKAACWPITVQDALDDMDGRMHMLSQAVTCDGQPLTFEMIRSRMEPGTKVALETVWLALSGPESTQEDGANPTASTSTAPAR